MTHLMVVLSNSKPGREDEFNEWYDDVHVHDTVNKLRGFRTAQRYELADLEGAPDHPCRYLAIYEIDDDDLDTAYADFRMQRAERAQALAAGREPLLPVSDAIDGGTTLVGFFSPLGGLVRSTRDDSGH